MNSDRLTKEIDLVFFFVEIKSVQHLRCWFVFCSIGKIPLNVNDLTIQRAKTKDFMPQNECLK